MYEEIEDWIIFAQREIGDEVGRSEGLPKNIQTAGYRDHLGRAFRHLMLAKMAIFMAGEYKKRLIEKGLVANMNTPVTAPRECPPNGV